MSEHVPRFTDSANYKCLECLRHKNFDLYLCYCGIEHCDPCHTYGPTERTEYLVHYILSGKGTFTTNGVTYHLSSHQAFLILPNETTVYTADKDQPWTYVWVGFDGEKAKTYLSYANLDETHRVCSFPYANLMFEQVQNMLNARELTYSNELKREGYLYLFLSYLIEHQSLTNSVDKEFDYPYQTHVNRAIQFIQDNYHKHIKIQALANHIGISRSCLTSSFKKALNMSPQSYLLSYRLDKACLLLKNTSLTINIIANNVGYDDPLAFSKLFKLHKGVSPTAYRSINESLEIISNRLP